MCAGSVCVCWSDNWTGISYSRPVWAVPARPAAQVVVDRGLILQMGKSPKLTPRSLCCQQTAKASTLTWRCYAASYPWSKWAAYANVNSQLTSSQKQTGMTSASYSLRPAPLFLCESQCTSDNNLLFIRGAGFVLQTNTVISPVFLSFSFFFFNKIKGPVVKAHYFSIGGHGREPLTEPLKPFLMFSVL